MNPAPELDLTRLAVLLGDCPVGCRVDYHRVLPSAMPRGHELAAQANAPAGTVVACEEQSAGRGRSTRQWQAPYATSLLLGVLLKPPLLPAHPAQIPMLAGIAVVQALAATVPELAAQLRLKWPNDVLLSAKDSTNLSDSGKVAGILAEAVFAGGRLEHAVLGIGINVNQTQAELPPVDGWAVPPASLRTASGHDVDRTALLAALCHNLAAQLAPVRPPAAIHAEWRGLLAGLGGPVVVHLHGDSPQQLAGSAVDVTPAGDLVVQDASGQCHTFAAADVSLRPAS